MTRYQIVVDFQSFTDSEEQYHSGGRITLLVQGEKALEIALKAYQFQRGALVSVDECC